MRKNLDLIIFSILQPASLDLHLASTATCSPHTHTHTHARQGYAATSWITLISGYASVVVTLVCVRVREHGRCGVHRCDMELSV